MPAPQFGLFIPPGPGWRLGSSRETFVADVHRSLDQVAGVFDSVWVPDHFQMGDRDVLESWSVLSYFAALYPSLKFGTMVISHSFRNPALLAKMAATIQFLTGGRLILGMGAGWNKEEYRAYGYDFPANGVRVEQLDEALQVIGSLWRGSITTFAGNHYAVTGARCEPRPAQPPVLMIGGKKPRMLRLAGRRADWWNADWVSPSAYLQLASQVDAACAEVGRDPATLRKTWLALCSCAPTEEAAYRALDGGYFEGRSEQGLVGTPEQIVDRLRPMIDAGMDYWMLATPRFPDPATLDLVIGEVIPRLKSEYGG